MADGWGAILGGILGGLGQGGVAYGQARESAADRALKQQQIDIQRQQAERQAAADEMRNTLAERQLAIQEGEKFTSVPAAALPAAMKGVQPDENGLVKVPTRSLPYLEAARKSEMEQGRITTLQNVLNRRDIPDYGGEPVPGGPEGPTQRPAGMSEVAGAALAVPGGEKYLELLKKPTDAFTLTGGGESGQPLFKLNTRTGAIEMVSEGTGPKVSTGTVNTQEGVFRETYDRSGNVIRRERIGSPVQQPREPRQATQGAEYVDAVNGLLAMEAKGIPKTDPTYQLQARKVDLLKSQVLMPGATLTGPTGTNKVEGGPTNPPGAQITEATKLDNMIEGFTDLSKRASDPKVTPALGVSGAPSRFLEDKLKMNVLTPEQRAFRADVGIQLTQAKALMLGLRQSGGELATLAPALPDENDPGIGQKMQAWANWAQRNRDNINKALGSLNMKVPGAGGGGTGKKNLKFDAAGNLIP